MHMTRGDGAGGKQAHNTQRQAHNTHSEQRASSRQDNIATGPGSILDSRSRCSVSEVRVCVGEGVGREGGRGRRVCCGCSG